MKKPSYRFVIHTDLCVKRFKPKYAEAQKYLDSEVLKDCDKYVPMRTGNLRNSGISGTDIGSGKVIYNAPYSRAMYYGTMLHFSKDKHPQASALWFEKAKAENKNKWMKGVQTIVRR